MKKNISLTILLVFLISACGLAEIQPTFVPLTAVPPTVEPPTQAPQQSLSILQSLPNAEYPIEITSTGKAQLKDGIFEEPSAPGSIAKTTVQLGNEQAFGDINGDGTEDIATTLVADPDGSGTFIYLALIINYNGTAKPLDAVLLGDRIIVKSIMIQSESVVVTMLNRKSYESMSAKPTVEGTRTFKLQSDKLIEMK